MEDMFTFKELEPCYLKATYPIEIDERTFEKGEILAKFDKIQVAGLESLYDTKTAHGGFSDRDFVFWETLKEINLTFSQGVFSKTQMAILSNSKLFKEEEKNKNIFLFDEVKESNKDGFFILKYEPVKLFVYDKETGVKLNFVQNKKEIRIEESFKEVIAQYYFEHENSTTVLDLGDNLLNGFLQLEGRTKIKDDKTGRIVTGIIQIPKLKLLSGLSLRLGSSATPVVANFSGIGIPVGSKEKSYVAKISFLENDIDSDF